MLGYARRHAVARVLFNEATDTSVVVDCALIRAETSEPTGTPFALRLRLPETPVLKEMTLAVLRDWAWRNQVVDVDVLPERQRASLGDAATRLWLELEAVSGLEAWEQAA